ncbi:MAG: hypothetical protein AVDCRST_MAG40-1727, partial [uncultured Gemmatimonadaceae bacterium]
VAPHQALGRPARRGPVARHPGPPRRGRPALAPPDAHDAEARRGDPLGQRLDLLGGGGLRAGA